MRLHAQPLCTVVGAIVNATDFAIRAPCWILSEDLLKRRELIAAGSRVAGGPPLIKEIGTDALFALHIVADHTDRHLGTSILPKVRSYFEACRAQDLGFAVAQTDVKGDRGKRPSEQHNPDVYVRVVDRREDGIVVRGGYQEILSIHAEGSLAAQRITILRDYDVKRCVDIAKSYLKD